MRKICGVPSVSNVLLFEVFSEYFSEVTVVLPP